MYPHFITNNEDVHRFYWHSGVNFYSNFNILVHHDVIFSCYFFSIANMTSLFTVWVWLVASEVIYTKIVTIHNNGENATECCAVGTCFCNSIHSALSLIENDTVINITSETVLLLKKAVIGSGNIHNITITGNGATIMCNNSGGVHCESCSNVIIEGITWDQCGDPTTPSILGVSFDHITSLMIIKCVFQWFRVCIAVIITYPAEYIFIIDSKFLHNNIEDTELCMVHSNTSLSYYSVLILNYSDRMNLTIFGSIFYHNGHLNHHLPESEYAASLGFYRTTVSIRTNIMISDTLISSNGILGMFLGVLANSSTITLNNVTFLNNSYGALWLVNQNTYIFEYPYESHLNIVSSNFGFNSNYALKLTVGISKLNIHRTSFIENKSINKSMIIQILITWGESVELKLSYCNFQRNFGESNIKYVSEQTSLMQSVVTIISCHFIQNIFGSALHISHCILKFQDLSLFHSNSAESGAALYLEHISQFTIEEDTSVQFINNTASLYGGAIYVNLVNCPNYASAFSYLSEYTSAAFINNSAGVSGNSIYFNIPASCDVERDETSNDSLVHIPYKFTYSQRRGTIGPAVATSPYEIKLCSPVDCGVMDNDKSTCLIEGTKMLGLSIDFSAVVCDYYHNANAEAVQFKLKCIDCGIEYQLANNKVLVFNGSSNKFIVHSIHATHDITDPVNITLNISSVLSREYRQFAATLSVTLSSCHSGFAFKSTSQQCECYKHDKDIVRCSENYAEIKQGYWFGYFSSRHTVSICPNFYCNYVHRKKN